MTGVYAADTPRLIRDGFEPVSHATVTDGVTTLPLDLEEWELTVDETRIPHAKLTARGTIPDSLDLLDPRAETWIDLEAGYRWADETEDVHPYAHMRLYAAQINRPAGTIALTAYSDEARLEDAAVPLDRGTGSPIAYATAAEMMLGQIDSDSYNLGPIPTVLPDEYPMTLNPESIKDPMESVRAWADSIGCVVYCDQLGVWQIQRAPTLSTSQAILSPGARGTLASVLDTVTRTEGWGTHLFLTYNDPEHDPRWWAEYDGTEPGELERVVVIERNDYPQGATADSNGRITDPAIWSLAARVRDRAEQLEFTIPAHYWLRALHTVTVTTPDRAQQRVLVSSITTTSKGRQTIRTRKPTT